MGVCFSISSRPAANESVRRIPAANVVSISGELRQFPLPVTVAEVLKSLNAPLRDFFLCDADSLSFDEYIPSIKPEQQLGSATIYFVMPSSKLRYRLAASDMANLAAKASVALGQETNVSNSRGGKRKSRVSPSVFVAPAEDHEIDAAKIANTSVIPSIAAGSMVTNVNSSRSYSKRGKLAVRSFKIRLTTISEGSVLVPD